MICEPGMIISSRTNRILAIHGEIPNRRARPAQTPARMRPSRGTDEALTAERLHDSTTPSATDTLDDHASGAPGPRHRGSPWNFPDEAALRSGLFDSVARVYRLGTSIQGGREQEVTMPATASAPVRRRPSGEPPPLPREDRWIRRIWVLAAVLLLGAGLSVLIATTDVVQTADEAVLSWFAEARSSALTDAAKLVALLTTFAAVMTLRHRPGPGGVSALPPPGGLPGDPGGDRLGGGPAAVRRAAASHRAGPGRRGRVRVPVQGDLHRGHHAGRDELRPGGARQGPQPAPRGIHRGAGAGGPGRALPRRRPPVGHGVRGDPGAVRGGRGVPLAGSRGGLPVTYRKRGSAAHLDLGGERGAAIVRAMADQLGLTVTEVTDFGLEGSGGSSPLRMTLQDGSRVFGKIYSTSHERADRWYRSGARSCTDSSRTRPRSARCGASPPTRTTRCACSPTTGCGSPAPTASSSSPPTRSTCWSRSSSRTPGTWATRRSTTW